MAKTQKVSNDLPVVSFESQKDWRKWLGENHAKSSGLWLKFAKKGAGVESVSYAEALEEALCYGWIDGQKDKFDESFWLQKFTRRGPKSIWSKINRDKAQALIDSGRMHASGLAAVELAKQDGRWNAAYDSHRTSTVPDDFQAELDKNAKAKAFFATLNNNNRYAILFRLQTAKKAETRQKKIEQFIRMLENSETIHPQ